MSEQDGAFTLAEVDVVVVSGGSPADEETAEEGNPGEAVGAALEWVRGCGRIFITMSSLDLGLQSVLHLRENLSDPPLSLQ